MSWSSDVLVVGGGAIGGALAWALARRGLTVTMVEAGRIGRGASRAAAGVLAPDRSAETPPALAVLAADSLALWPDWLAELEERAETRLNFRKDGLLHLWVDPGAPHLPPDLTVAPPPLGAGSSRRLDADEVRALEPALTGPIAGAILSPDDAQVDNPRLAPALIRAATALGMRVRTEAPVLALLGSGGRCTGVRTARGDAIAAGAVILAAGAWSGPLAAASGLSLPMEPWRGQMLAFDAVARPLRHIVSCGELVLVPRPHGPLVVGTTLEEVGFDARATLAGLHQILARAARIVPGLGDLPLVRAWAGLRPGTPDLLPYLGPVPGWEGLFAATGHGRKGIILAPITGELMARLILENDLDPRLIPCLPSRVAASDPAETDRGR
ncbi:MAG TPA: glycine oxidase ThiO [Isosphaeraceae bacterium]|nr:glycine oxidase ThiO [Isosphaeraceae bacterium]